MAAANSLPGSYHGLARRWRQRRQLLSRKMVARWKRRQSGIAEGGGRLGIGCSAFCSSSSRVSDRCRPDRRKAGLRVGSDTLAGVTLLGLAGLALMALFMAASGQSFRLTARPLASCAAPGFAHSLVHLGFIGSVAPNTRSRWRSRGGRPRLRCRRRVRRAQRPPTDGLAGQLLQVTNADDDHIFASSISISSSPASASGRATRNCSAGPFPLRTPLTRRRCRATGRQVRTRHRPASARRQVAAAVS